MAFIPALLDFLLTLLEALFSTPPQVAPEDNHDYSSHHQSPEQRDAALQAALKFFEITPGNLSREVLKKKFRRFSLLHHPDRNNNTEESKQTMQKVNNFYNILNEELDRREGIHHESEEEKEEEVHDESPRKEEEQPETSHKQRRNQNKNRGKQSKSARKRQRRQARKREEEAQARMHEEMRKEYEEVRRQQREVKREQQRQFKKSVQTALRHGLDTGEGRDKAYREWKEAIETMSEPVNSNKEETKTPDAGPKAENGTNATKKETASGLMDNIDGDEAELDTEVSEDEPVPVKPVNLVMECCMKDAVIALRMGLTDVVIEGIQNDIERGVEKVVAKAFFRGREQVSKSEVFEVALKSLIQSLDEDGNTLLHYAVYYESNDLVSVIYHFAVTFEALAEVFLATNHYQMIPLDFSKCCVKDPSLAGRMKHFTDSAREDLASKRLLPSLKQSARRLWGILRNVNMARLVRPANFLLSYWIGTHLFGRSRIISLLLAVMPTFSRFQWEERIEMDDERKAHAATLFAAHLSWRCFYWLFCLVPWVLWCVLLLILIFAKGARPTQDYWATVLSIPLLIVFAPLFHFFQFLEMFIRLPALIKSGSQLERTATLLIFTAEGYALVRLGIAYYRGDEGDEILLVEEDTMDDAIVFTGEFESLL